MNRLPIPRLIFDDDPHSHGNPVHEFGTPLPCRFEVPLIPAYRRGHSLYNISAWTSAFQAQHSNCQDFWGDVFNLLLPKGRATFNALGATRTFGTIESTTVSRAGNKFIDWKVAYTSEMLVTHNEAHIPAGFVLDDAESHASFKSAATTARLDQSRRHIVKSASASDFFFFAYFSNIEEEDLDESSVLLGTVEVSFLPLDSE
jgi:hypothetical protein